jgi:hypothetical protein
MVCFAVEAGFQSVGYIVFLDNNGLSEDQMTDRS